MDKNIRQNVFIAVSNKTLFFAYLVIVLCFSAGANLDSSRPNPTNPTSFISGYDIAEIVCLFLFILNNSIIAYNEKKINVFIVLCLIFPVVLVMLKLIINSVTLKSAAIIIIFNGCMRMFVLYLSFVYNLMNLDDIMPLIYDNKEMVNIDIQRPIPQVDPELLEIKIERANENNLVIKQNQPNISPIRSSILNDNSQASRFPILIPGKVKLPIFISFELTTEKGKESKHDISFLEELTILYDHETVNNINLQDKYTDLISELNRIGDIDFNVFKVSTYSNELELLVLMNHLSKLYNFEQLLEIPNKVYQNFFYIVNISYRKNTYHNSIHATDVLQTFYFLTKTCNVDIICNLNELELFSCFFAAAIHDLDHPGNNNLYEIAVQSSLAISYNDKAVLENYHLYKAFSILKKPDSDIFSSLNRQNYSRSRSMIINIVLSTDMAVHFNELGNLKNRIKASDFDPKSIGDKDILLNQLIHACDISNPTKPFEIYQVWVDRVFQEFYNQGDKEREQGLKISFLCDRNTVNIPEAQIGFIDGIVNPVYDTLTVPFPNLKMISNMISNNKENFKILKEELREKNEKKE